MSIHQSLKSLKQEFTQWRKNKKSLRSRVPDELRRKVLALRPFVDDCELNRELGIKPPMLQLWSEREANSTAVSQSPVEFVSLPTELIESDVKPVTIDNPQNPVQLSYELADGNRWSLQGQVNPQQMAAFIHTLNQMSGGVK